MCSTRGKDTQTDLPPLPERIYSETGSRGLLFKVWDLKSPQRQEPRGTESFLSALDLSDSSVLRGVCFR